MKAFLTILLLSWGLLAFYLWDNMRTNCCGPQIDRISKSSPAISKEELLPSLPLNPGPSAGSTSSDEVRINSSPSANFPESEKTEEETQSNVLNTTEKTKISTADYIIYFKEGDSNWHDDKAVMAYINQLSERVKVSKEKIIVSAYDDDVAAPSESFAMTKRRAWRVRKAFKDDYVRRQLVVMKSEGQEYPTATNETKEGRAKNRRVEIKIIKE